MHFFWDTFIFLLIVIDPIALIPLFIALTRMETEAGRLKIARRTCLISFLLFILFAFLGEALLDSLGIGTPALQIAGGILLLRVAIEMLQPGGSTTPTGEDSSDAPPSDIAVFPLAIPLIAGPGALTGVIMKMREATGEPMLQGFIVLSIVLISLLNYGLLFWSNQVARFLGSTGTNIIVRVFGIILAALACEFILSGLSTGLIRQ
jgi:multiple antibiotic resistance protein